MASIGSKGKGLFSYDVDVSKAFHAKKGDAIITLREPTSKEYLLLAQVNKKDTPEEAIETVIGLITATTIKAEEGKDEPVALDYLRQVIKDNGSLYIVLYQEWQKLLPFDRQV
jgi:hypothetical protein